MNTFKTKIEEEKSFKHQNERKLEKQMKSYQ